MCGKTPNDDYTTATLRVKAVGGLAAPGRPCCSRGTSHFCREVSTAGFVTWICGFLTAAHVVSKCLLMARELDSEHEVPSDSPTELIPFLFGVVNRAILVVLGRPTVATPDSTAFLALVFGAAGGACLASVVIQLFWHGVMMGVWHAWCFFVGRLLLFVRLGGWKGWRCVVSWIFGGLRVVG